MAMTMQTMYFLIPLAWALSMDTSARDSDPLVALQWANASLSFHDHLHPWRNLSFDVAIPLGGSQHLREVYPREL